jgi:hypothetical protein
VLAVVLVARLRAALQFAFQTCHLALQIRDAVENASNDKCRVRRVYVPACD